MKNSFVNILKKSGLFLLAIGFLASGTACNRSKCPANNGGYIDSHKMVSKQKHKKPKSGLFPKREKLHGF
jgi:hypothetical protein